MKQVTIKYIYNKETKSLHLFIQNKEYRIGNIFKPGEIVVRIVTEPIRQDISDFEETIDLPLEKKKQLYEFILESKQFGSLELSRTLDIPREKAIYIITEGAKRKILYKKSAQWAVVPHCRSQIQEALAYLPVSANVA